MTERIPVVIVGAGQAGLAASYELGRMGLEHILLERGRVGQSWRTRWNSFCMASPNWTIQLPGGSYTGDQADGFMLKDEIVAYLEAYAQGFRAPIREGARVTSVESASEHSFLLRISKGDIEAETVVIATGAYQKPHRPPGAASLPFGIHTIDSEAYTSADSLPPGRVLVVGSGQTGCQLAEELNESGREVVLACGRAPWAPRQIEGRDVVSWLTETPFMDQTLGDFAAPSVRLLANVQTTGCGGGHDLHYRTLLEAGVTLSGRFVGAGGDSVMFAPDLAESVAFGDSCYQDIMNVIRESCLERGEKPPEMPHPRPFIAHSPERMDLRGCGAVIFTSGFRPDYASWVRFPNAFDRLGFPIHSDGASSAVPGLYFIGTHFLRKRKSATLFGVGEDAAIVADRISSGLEHRAPVTHEVEWSAGWPDGPGTTPRAAESGGRRALWARFHRSPGRATR